MASSVSSGSYGNRSITSKPEETLRQLVRDLARSKLRLSEEDVFTPSGGQRGLMELSSGATILPSAGRANSAQARTEFNAGGSRVVPKFTDYTGASARRRIIEVDRGSIRGEPSGAEDNAFRKGNPEARKKGGGRTTAGPLAEEIPVRALYPRGDLTGILGASPTARRKRHDQEPDQQPGMLASSTDRRTAAQTEGYTRRSTADHEIEGQIGLDSQFYEGCFMVLDKNGQEVPARMGKFGKPVLCYTTFKQCEACGEFTITPGMEVYRTKCTRCYARSRRETEEAVGSPVGHGSNQGPFTRGVE